jgi:hypothetical protein
LTYPWKESEIVRSRGWMKKDRLESLSHELVEERMEWDRLSSL